MSVQRIINNILKRLNRFPTLIQFALNAIFVQMKLYFRVLLFKYFFAISSENNPYTSLFQVLKSL